MKPLAIALLLFIAASMVLIVWLVWTAPEGWEDEEGFHLGRQDASPRLPLPERLPEQPRAGASGVVAAGDGH